MSKHMKNHVMIDGQHLPQSDVETRNLTEVAKLQEVVRHLRAENGCPWDRAQTHESLKHSPEKILTMTDLCGYQKGRAVLQGTGCLENITGGKLNGTDRSQSIGNRREQAVR